MLVRVQEKAWASQDHKRRHCVQSAADRRSSPWPIPTRTPRRGRWIGSSGAATAVIPKTSSAHRTQPETTTADTLSVRDRGCAPCAGDTRMRRPRRATNPHGHHPAGLILGTAQQSCLCHVRNARVRVPCGGSAELAVQPHETWPPPTGAPPAPPYEDFLGRPSYEVCPNCGFEFGNDDNPGTGSPVSFEEFRAEWIAEGRTGFPATKIITDHPHLGTTARCAECADGYHHPV